MSCVSSLLLHLLLFFFFIDTAPTEIYTLSLHDALPISSPEPEPRSGCGFSPRLTQGRRLRQPTLGLEVTFAVGCASVARKRVLSSLRDSFRCCAITQR